jgi:hypothetical protein
MAVVHVPPDERGRPPARKAAIPTQLRPDEASHSVARSIRHLPTVAGVVTVNLNGYADRSGFATPEAGMRVWRACTTVPPGADFIIELGDIRHPDENLLQQLAEYGRDIGTIIFNGPDGDVVRQHIAALRRALSPWVAA